MQVVAEVIGSKRCVFYIARLQGFWPISVVEGEEGAGFPQSQWEFMISVSDKKPFSRPQVVAVVQVA